ncbi:MAG TPA: c-type cytochrome [Nitrospiria bacterium]
MGYFGKVVLFVAAFLLAFAYIGNQIPQQASLPPEELKFDPAEIKTKGDLAQIGQKIFYGKGKCALCHSIGHSATARCPNLQGIGGKLTRDFLYESLTEPQAYTFMDYTYSPPKFFPATMPVITKPPIGLNDNEMLAIMGFLESQGGEVTVDPSEIVLADGGLGSAGDVDSGRSVFGKLGCAGCHESGSLAGKEAGASRQAILDPRGGVKSGSEMVHEGFENKMTIKDFNDLTAYLGSL